MPQCKSLIFSHWKLFGRPPFYPALILATFINFCSGSRRSTLGVVPSLIPIYQFDFLYVFYFIIAYFFFALFTIQLKRKDGSVGSPSIEGTLSADQSRKHPFAQLNSLSLNLYFNSHRFHAHFPLSFSGTRAPLDNPRAVDAAAAALDDAPVEGADAADDPLSLISMMPEPPDPAPLSPHPIHPIPDR